MKLLADPHNNGSKTSTYSTKIVVISNERISARGEVTEELRIKHDVFFENV